MKWKLCLSVLETFELIRTQHQESTIAESRESGLRPGLQIASHVGHRLSQSHHVQGKDKLRGQDERTRGRGEDLGLHETSVLLIHRLAIAHFPTR